MDPGSRAASVSCARTKPAAVARIAAGVAVQLVIDVHCWPGAHGSPQLSVLVASHEFGVDGEPTDP
jgi:hypothetical protein